MANYISYYLSGYADGLRDVGKMLQKRKTKSLVAAGDKLIESADKVVKENNKISEEAATEFNNYISTMSFPGPNRESVMKTKDVILLMELIRKGIVKWGV